jgi:hypothetical protein
MSRLIRVSRVMEEYVARVASSLRQLRAHTEARCGTSEAWSSADAVRICWFVQTYQDLSRLRRTLAGVRHLYPESQVLVVSDGDPDPNIKHACDQYSAGLTLRSRLYGVEHGGELVQKILEEFLATDADILIKIDPDTKVHRRFSMMPSPLDSSIYGSVQSAGSESNRIISIQGGCIIVPRQAAILLAGSALLESDRLKFPALEWAVDHGLMARAASGLTSSDQTLGWACRELGLRCREHPEVFSRHRPSLMDALTQRRVAVFHPRFEVRHLINHSFYFSGFRAAVREAAGMRDDSS